MEVIQVVYLSHNECEGIWNVFGVTCVYGFDRDFLYKFIDLAAF